MKYLSVCSGIEAASVAWKPLGWKAVGFSEIEPFCCELLKQRFPDVKNYGDMTNYKEWNINEKIDILIGGTPCQSFSIAGLRGGLDDDRGNLALTFCHIADTYRPRWIVWENVPGVLSSNKGRDFGTFLGALASIGYGFAYRVLDAQFWGVAQRRRRVFVVGHLGDWRPPAGVLFDAESLRRNPKKSRKKKKRTAKGTKASINQYFENHPQDSRVTGPHKIANTVSAKYGTGGGNLPLVMSSGQSGASITHNKSPTLTCLHEQPFLVTPQPEHMGVGAQTSNMEIMRNKLPTLKARSDAWVLAGNTICFLITGNRDTKHGGNGTGFSEDISYTLTSTDRHAVATHGFSETGHGISIQKQVSPTIRQSRVNTVQTEYIARYLTPVECERLQGFPDNWTQIKWGNREAEDCPKTPRYEAIGNSMAVPVINWLGRRIELIEELIKETKK